MKQENNQGKTRCFLCEGECSGDYVLLGMVFCHDHYFSIQHKIRELLFDWAGKARDQLDAGVSPSKLVI